MAVYTKATEKDYEEISVIRINNRERAEELIQKASARLVKLKEIYKDNEEILTMLGDYNNIIIKQEGGVQTVIISKNAEQIAERLKAQF